MNRVHKRNTTHAHGSYFTRLYGANLARSHALSTKMQSIIDDQLANEVTTISIRGREGTGKTTLAKNIAHTLHTELSKVHYNPDIHDDYIRKHIEMIENGYTVRLLGADDLLHFADILKTMPPKKNIIFIFDDLSYIDELKNIKSELTKVRHLQGGDVKVVMIFNFHYSKAVDKYIRDTGFIFLTSISAEEIENLKNLFGRTRRHGHMIQTFSSIYHKFKRKRELTLNLAPRGKPPVFVKYQYSNPFRLGMFFDSHAASFFVYASAAHTGADSCVLCNSTEVQESKCNIDDVIEWLNEQYPPAKVMSAARALSYMRYGMDIRPNRNEIDSLPAILRLEKNGIIDAGQFLRTIFDLSETQLGYQKQSRIPTKVSESFLHKFSIDGFRDPKI